MCIHINLDEKFLVNGKNGKVKRLECFEMVAQYHAYLEGTGHLKAAQHLLEDAFKGKKVITDLISQYQSTK
jgi:hypothetical protein